MVAMKNAADPRQRQILALLVDRAHAGVPGLDEPAIAPHADNVRPRHPRKVREHGGNDLFDRGSVIIRFVVAVIRPSPGKQYLRLCEKPRLRVGQVFLKCGEPTRFGGVVRSERRDLRFEFGSCSRMA
jgi:hypothetical protein